MKKTSYDKAFKEHAVNLWLASGKSAQEVANELGIKRDRLYIWKEALDKKPSDCQAGSVTKRRTAQQLEQELAQLQCENQMLRQQRDILKKTLGILSEAPGSAISGSKS
jgi:transposase